MWTYVELLDRQRFVLRRGLPDGDGAVVLVDPVVLVEHEVRVDVVVRERHPALDVRLEELGRPLADRAPGSEVRAAGEDDRDVACGERGGEVLVGVIPRHTRHLAHHRQLAVELRRFVR